MTTPSAPLVFHEHSRDIAGLTYVYPVLSRRAGGVSVGVNLNPNNACNWHCAYCQVPGLTRGGPPAIRMEQLESELRYLLRELVFGAFMVERVPEGFRRVMDIALSGNGEPTSAREFPQVIRMVRTLRDEFGLQEIPIRVITNGSLLARGYVQEGFRLLGEAGGEAWFKLDGGRSQDFARINGVELSPRSVITNLGRCADACPTWIQTCYFRWDGQLPDEEAVQAYLQVLGKFEPGRLAGVLLYGVARTSMQPEAVHVSGASSGELEDFANRIRDKGLTVKVSP